MLKSPQLIFDQTLENGPVRSFLCHQLNDAKKKKKLTLLIYIKMRKTKSFVWILKFILFIYGFYYAIQSWSENDQRFGAIQFKNTVSIPELLYAWKCIFLLYFKQFKLIWWNFFAIFLNQDTKMYTCINI